MSERAIRYRLGRTRLALALTCLITLALVAVYARGWSQVPERPWFALALVLSAVVGGALAWSWARRWHTVTVRAQPPRLRVHGLLRSRDFDLTGAALHLQDFTVTGRAPMPSALGPLLVRTSGRRSALNIRTPEESLVIHGLGGNAGRVRTLAQQLKGELGLELTSSQETRSRIGFARYTDGARRTVSLNPDLGASHLPGLLALVALGMVLLLGAPVALQQPSYIATVAASPQPVIDEWTSHLDAAGISPVADPGPVEVVASWSVCEKSGSWLWGDSDVARLELRARLPIAAAQEQAVRDRLDGLLEQRDRGWRQLELGRTVTLEDGHLATRMIHACLPADQQERAEEEIAALLSTWMLWLADTEQA